MECIYKITSPNNRIYIGKTKDIDKRKKYYKSNYCKPQTLLYNSLVKYGFENHKFEIIEELENHFNSGAAEIFWIDFYKSNYKRYPENNGLNLTDGGENNKGNNIIRVYEYDLDGNYLRYWNSQSDACRYYNVKINHIPQACNGKLKTFIKKRWSYYKVDKLPIMKGLRKDTKYKDIIQLDLNGNIIKEWNSIGEICRNLGFSHSGLIQAVKKNGICKGYKWILK